jgi:hypothetical protein
MRSCRTLALAFAGTALFASLPAAADTSPPPQTPVVTVQVPGPAPAPAQPGAYPPGAYPPGAYPGGPPAPYYGPPGYPPPGAYYGPPPGAYYAPAYPVPHPTERQSVGAMVGGIIGVTGGGILLLAGAFAAIPSCSFDDSVDNETCNNHTALTIGLVVAGVVAIAAGVPLIVYGAKKVPLGTATALPPSPLPAWAGAPGGPGWRWTF